MSDDTFVQIPQGSIRTRESGPSSGHPIVFVHGFMVNGLLWRKVTPLLASEGFRCITPDWPLGSHARPMAPDADLTPTGLARIVDAFLEASGLEAVTLVGNDTGGAVAQITAAEHPKRVARLVLTNCDAYDNFPPRMFRYLKLVPRVPGALRLTSISLASHLVRRMPFTFGGVQNAPLDHQVIDAYTAPQKDPAIRRDVAKVIRGLDPRYTIEAAAALRSFDRPVLLAWGTDDRFFPLEHARRLARELPNGRVVEIPGSKAFVPEDAPDILAEHIATFIRGTNVPA